MLTFAVLGGPRLLRDAVATRLTADFPGCVVVADSTAPTVGEPVPPACSVLVDDSPAGSVTSLVAGPPIVAVHWARAGRGAERHAVSCLADACLSGESPLASLAVAVGAALEGTRWVAPELDAAREGAVRVTLSPQERRALALYASGLTLDSVAQRMEITPNTAKHYLNRVRDKYADAGLEARTKVELHQLARSEGYLP